MLARQHFICSAIEQCQEKVNCCPHKTPHIKDERCVPRECRYAPGISNIDCDPFDPAHPRAPVPVPVAPIKTVEQKMKEQTISVTVDETTPELIDAFIQVKGDSIKHDDGLVADIISETVTQEIDIKEQVKKAAASQRPVTVKKPQKKGNGQKKVPEKQS